MNKRQKSAGRPTRAGKTKQRIVHGTRVFRGYCRDCAQGTLGRVHSGFEYWDEHNEGSGFWFCRYCGSNHVTITVDGEVIEQGDLY